MFERGMQAITHSKGVTKIRIIYTLQGIKHDNMTLKSHEDTSSGHSSRRGQGDDPGPPHPTARLPHDTSTGIHRWLMHYPDLHPLGMVG
jgi:hypothetical protein